MAEQARNVIRVFYAYASKDKNLRDRLEMHLTILKRTGQITSWSHYEIDPGKEWSQETVTHLNSAQIILLLISADFIASDYSYGIELKRAIQRHEQEEARVIPIILRPVDLEDAPFSKLQVLPANGRPVVKWGNRDDAFVDIARGIRKTVAELRGARTNEPWQSKNFVIYKTEYYEEALTAYEFAKGLDAQAYYTKGNILRNLMHYKEALASYEMAIRLDPTFADAYHAIGSVHYALKQLDEALAAYEKAIELNRNDSYAYYSKAIIFYRLNNYKEAFTTYRQAINLDSAIIQTYLDNELALEEPVSYQKVLIEKNYPFVRFFMSKKKLPGIIAAVVLPFLALVFAILGFIRSPWWLVVSVFALSAFIFLAYVARWKWTGLPEQKGPSGSKDIFYQGPKTVWDWVQIVIIPVVLLYIAGSIAYTQMTISNDAFNMQHAADVQMAQDQLNESELSSYLSSMSGLLLQATVGKNGQVNADIRIRGLARAQTLTVLQELVVDPKLGTSQPNSIRKARVLKFLHDSGLINRDPFPIVSLADADLRYAALQMAHLSGANLARANLSYANLNWADLTAADLSQTTLDHADLSRAKLVYAQITGDSTYVADLSNSNLYQADLSGADLTGAILSNANFTQADVTGTTLPTNAGYSGKPLSSTKWKLIQTDSTVVIAYNGGTTLTAYGMLDLNTSKLQLVYGPYSKWGTSIVLLPVIASQQACPNDYCETAPITITMPLKNIVVSGSDVSIPISGTIAGLTVGLTLKFYFSSTKQDSISVNVSAMAKGASAIPLDPPNPPKLSFNPVLLHAIFLSPDLWSAQQAFIAGQPHFSFPTPNLNQIEAQTFGLIGGTSSKVLVRNAPTIKVTISDPKSLLVTAEVQPSSDGSFNNVSLWGAFKKVQDSWSYTVMALYPYNTTP